jgi:predicted DsbA family dithiol-disulfide isomerase/uncharacterized membrane protein
MRKITNALMLLAGVGAGIAILLTVGHFSPDFARSIPLCGEGVGSCTDIYQLPHSALLGVPIAAYGLFFYLVVLFTLLAADAAGGRYYRESAVVLLPLCALALLVDLGLGITLIILKEFCVYCIATYVINVALFLLLIALFAAAKKADGTSFWASIRSILRTRGDETDRRAVYALYVICVALIFSSVFFLSYALGNRTRGPEGDITASIEDFYKTPPVTVDFPESVLVTGNPDAPLTIYVFTDFLCSACYQLYKNEQVLLNEFKGQVRFAHYNYPLDETCNESVGRTIYRNSCVASRSMIAASEADVFIRYYERHYSRYAEYAHDFSPEDVSANIKGLVDSGLFERYMGSPETTDIIQRDIRLAKELGVKGTPTLFINGRKVGGVPPVEVMEKVISRELSALRDKNQ